MVPWANGTFDDTEIHDVADARPPGELAHQPGTFDGQVIDLAAGE